MICTQPYECPSAKRKAAYSYSSLHYSVPCCALIGYCYPLLWDWVHEPCRNSLTRLIEVLNSSSWGMQGGQASFYSLLVEKYCYARRARNFKSTYIYVHSYHSLELLHFAVWSVTPCSLWEKKGQCRQADNAYDNLFISMNKIQAQPNHGPETQKLNSQI